VATAYTVSDGKLVLTLTPAEEGGFVVTSPMEPELVTEADTIEDAFRMAHDAHRALRASRVRRVSATARAAAFPRLALRTSGQLPIGQSLSAYVARHVDRGFLYWV